MRKIKLSDDCKAFLRKALQFLIGLAILAVGSALTIRAVIINDFAFFGLGLFVAIVGAIIISDII